MGANPFNDYAEEYLKKMQRNGTYSPETIANRRRRYKRMNAFVVELRNRKMISTSSPKNFTEKDIYTILTEDAEHHSPSDMAHEVNALRNLCHFCDNMNMDVCLNHNQELKPKFKGNRRKGSMQAETREAILERALKVDPADFNRLRAYALVLLCIDTGARNKEIRLAEVRDLDMRSWTIHFEHVKGEATYGEPRDVPIREEIRPVVEAYMKARTKWVFDNHVASPFIFPSNSKKSADGEMCGNSLRRIKQIVEEDLHIKFDLRECRRTFGQRYLDEDLELTSVSVLMGHSTTRTTEKFYGRRKNQTAIEKARAVWRKNDTTESPEKGDSKVDSAPNATGGQSQEMGGQ